MKYKEIEQMGVVEIREKIIENRQALAKERATIASGVRSENPGKIRKLRREVAKMLTALNVKMKSKTEEKKKNAGN
ncbi:MAG: 50S ribosomal protein L29 [Candidatus Diapherotrites archaeon]|nr:50S ribosomal protein L29 [Candidatus Diapherotrites archaeon]